MSYARRQGRRISEKIGNFSWVAVIITICLFAAGMGIMYFLQGVDAPTLMQREPLHFVFIVVIGTTIGMIAGYVFGVPETSRRGKK